MTTSIIACEVMREELLAILGSPHDRLVQFVSMGLHVSPKKLRTELQSRILELQQHDRIVLGFGLCGEATAGLLSPRVPLIIPRVADCIPLLLGAAAQHRARPFPEQGTFYLSGGWVEGERNLLTEHERAVNKFGEHKARRALNTLFAPYQRLLFIRTGHPRERECLEKAKRFAKISGLALETKDGQSAWLTRLVHGPWAAEEFLRVEPNHLTTTDSFNQPRGCRTSAQPNAVSRSSTQH
ncbi:MAG TPA: DUF1638 domain-containing protein [Polyangiaceae bacterium]|nr:DUF1638 domain-containing protein [Polyangiaceae bacterium]